MQSDRNTSVCVPPEIQTARLRLRAHRREDLTACCALWADPHVVRFIGGVPSPRQRTWARLLAYLGHWAVMGFGYWVLEERASGAFVGEIGWAIFERDDVPALPAGPELGFALAPRFHGRGYATEAVAAVLHWGETHLPFERGFAWVDVRNDASLRVLVKCGFEVLEHCDSHGQPAIILQRPLTATARPSRSGLARTHSPREARAG